jgi:hypothetical protein
VRAQELPSSYLGRFRALEPFINVQFIFLNPLKGRELQKSLIISAIIAMPPRTTFANINDAIYVEYPEGSGKRIPVDLLPYDLRENKLLDFMKAVGWTDHDIYQTSHSEPVLNILLEEDITLLKLHEAMQREKLTTEHLQVRLNSSPAMTTDSCGVAPSCSLETMFCQAT